MRVAESRNEDMDRLCLSQGYPWLEDLARATKRTSGPIRFDSTSPGPDRIVRSESTIDQRRMGSIESPASESGTT